MINALTVAAAVLADHDHHMDGWHMEGWDWVWGSFMVLFWIAVLAGIVWFVVSRSRGSGGGTRRAREILDERYARGELSTDEYRERLNELR